MDLVRKMDWSSLLLTALGALCLSYVLRHLLWRLTVRLPPGPWGLPLVGYLPFLGKVPYQKFLELKETYGNIFGMYLGTTYTVVLNDFADIKEALNREEYLDRPAGWFEMSENYDHLVNMNGWEWKETRKFVVTTLRQLGVGRSKVEEAIKEEVREVLRKLEGASPGSEVNLMDTWYLPLLNIIMTIVFGRPFDDGDRLLKTLAKYNEEVLQRVLLNHNQVFFPFLRPYFSVKKRQARNSASKREMEGLISKETERHVREFDDNNVDDFTAHYLKEMKRNTSSRTSLSIANLLGNSQGLMFAGTDTTRTTLAWLFLHLAEHQKGQERMYREILALLGKEKSPSWSDRDELPYTNAFIWESARFRTLAPAEDPHWSTKDSTFRGFFIPKNSIIIANVEAVHGDKKLWGDPENFRPERFLSAEGKKATLPEYWIPFLIGKRVCAGAKLANMQIFLSVTSLVQRFQVVGPKSGLCTDSQFLGLTFPVKPVVSFKPRA